MIEEVLELIVERGIIDKREIAHQVGIQIETLDHVIDLLCQKGYLQLSEKTCTENPTCSGCSQAESCGSADKLGRALFVTERGKQLVKTRREKRR
jgi:hypothetical protein